MDIFWTENILESCASFAIEHGGHWGIRRMLKIASKQTLEKLKSRVSARLIEDRCYLLGGNPNRLVVFRILVTNPTPWDLTIIDIACSITYNDIVFVQKASVVESLRIKLERETISGKLVNVSYDPFNSLLGLPVDQKGWRLKGIMSLSGYFGVFDVSIPEILLTKGELAQERVWSDSVNYVNKIIGRY